MLNSSKRLSKGSLNLATRSLPCLPSALFEVHLNMTPEPLKSVPIEPVLPPLDSTTCNRGRNQNRTTWFEAQDLTVLKAWNNEIQEIQHEISLFGSLKTVDVGPLKSFASRLLTLLQLHKNKLISLPDSFADLTALTILDLSHNALTVVPDNLFALPELISLNLSYNQLSSLPFNAPFKDSSRSRVNQQASISFFGPVVTRSSAPLPRLLVLDVSHNKILAQNIDSNLPVSLSKVDLSSNPIGHVQQLIRNFASLKRLKELRFAHVEIGDDSFPLSLLPSQAFPSLRVLDLEDTLVHVDTIKEVLQPLQQELNFDFVDDDPPEGVIRVLVGKRIIQEAWEIELERSAKARVSTTVEVVDDWPESQIQKRSNSRANTTFPKPLPTKPATNQEVTATAVPAKPKEVQKEDWEIEAERGLATAGGRRRARAAAENGPDELVKDTSPSSSLGLSNSQYYTASTQTLHLPSSALPSRGHVRAFSVATPGTAGKFSSRVEDVTVPLPTFPLSTIITQPFAPVLRILILSNRRMDRSFYLPSLPENSVSFLPCLEELDLEGCNLNDLVPTVVSPDAGAASPPRSYESLIPLITKLFPSLITLNLSHNTITNASLTPEVLSNLILASDSHKGLRHLRLRGNKISDLHGFSNIAESFKGHRQVPEWKLEELDIRDNEISKLPPELGLLPLDVFLVDGNVSVRCCHFVCCLISCDFRFRAPQRRVWEREGTKGLLSWLRGRLE